MSLADRSVAATTRQAGLASATLKAAEILQQTAKEVTEFVQDGSLADGVTRDASVMAERLKAYGGDVDALLAALPKVTENLVAARQAAAEASSLEQELKEWAAGDSMARAMEAETRRLQGETGRVQRRIADLNAEILRAGV